MRLFQLIALAVGVQASRRRAADGAQAAFDPLQHSGAASPYFDAPDLFGIAVDTPAGCVVDQAAFIVRHGSRFPEPGSFAGWQNLFAKFQNSSYTASGSLSFIGSWVPPVDDAPHEPLFLSSTGARESFDLGVQLRQRYRFTSGGQNMTVWAASQQRVVDTATYFTRGYLSQGNYLAAPSLNRGTIITLPDSVNFTFANSLTASAACPLYPTGDQGSATSNAFRATYQAAIAKRLNGFLNGLSLNVTDIGPMQDLCGFSDEIDGDTRFCDIFTPSEWEDYEYALDLNYYYGSGPGNPFSATNGIPWVQAITDIFVAGPGNTVEGGTFTPPPLIMGFTHDNDLPPVVSALGILNATAVPLSLTTPDARRTFRSSYLVAFRGYVALERLTCTTPPHASPVAHVANTLSPDAARAGKPLGTFVRVRVDNAPVPIPGCTSGPGSSCPLTSFVAHVKERAAFAGDFVQRCGLQNQANATGVVSFLTTDPASAEELAFGNAAVLVGLN